LEKITNANGTTRPWSPPYLALEKLQQQDPTSLEADRI
jgi:hypothetical protein